MSDNENARSESYQDARSKFDDLGAEEKASFLVESALAMLARGVNQASEVVSNAIDEIVEELNRCKTEDEGAEEDEPAAPPAPKKKAAAKKKPAARKRGSTAKKKTDDEG